MKVIDFADTPVALDRRRLSFGLALFTASACLQAMSEAKAAPSDKALVVTHYRTRMVDGIRIF
jgi:hypothetical protein